MKKRELNLDTTIDASKKSASPSTRIKNTFEAYRADVVGAHSTEYQIAKCGCCSGSVPKIDGVWDQNNYQFLNAKYEVDGEHLRVHPALWNNGSCNVLSGVFEVLPGRIYQVRGYDMANITFVKTNNVSSDEITDSDNWMVMDTLMSTECTKAALELFKSYLSSINTSYDLMGRIVGMIVSHSHVDHYGGMSTVKEWFTSTTTEDKVDAPAIPFILAPSGFVEHSVSENVYVGNAMGRRASYQYGSFIKPSAEISGDDRYSGEISIGIGQGQSTGKISFELPTREISENCSLKLDELDVDFQLTPGTEAPAEMNNYFPQYNALWLAENCNGTLHNLYTLRGAQVRDGKAWARYLMETVALYGDDVQMIFQSHNWPHWDDKLDESIKPTNGIDDEFPKCNLRSFLIETAAIYKYINDQTLLYMNMGYKMNEASDMLTLPRAMQKNWCLKPFYGTPKHNSKAVYQRYLGWYDANPLHLEELPPEQLAREQLRYTLTGGSVDNILALISKDLENGNYWTAAYMAHQIVLASSDESEVGKARYLCADALEQLGYQSESGTWRNAYLCAAYELRNSKGRVSASAASMTTYMTTEMLLDYISILFDGERAAGLNYDGYLSIDGEDYVFCVKNGAILYHPVTSVPLASDGVEYLEIEKSDLNDVLRGAYCAKQSEKKDIILENISLSIISLQCDRYKYFDIMKRHDSEVKVDDAVYNLSDMATECLFMLEKYITDVEKNMSTTVSFAGTDSTKWETYQKVLVEKSQLLLDGKFFDPSDSNAGIGADGKFFGYELYYNLYSLLRYLNLHYLKNSNHIVLDGVSVDSLERLKKMILLLESYVDTCYMQGAEFEVTFDAQDVSAWQYLTGEDLSSKSMSIARFMRELYMSHRELARIVGTVGKRISSLGNLDSETELLVKYNIPNNSYWIKYGASESQLKADESDIKIPVPEDSPIVTIFVFKEESGNKTVVDSIVFYKPIIECSSSRELTQIKVAQLEMQLGRETCDLINLGTDAEPVIAAAYEASNKPIEYIVYYKTCYADRLFIDGSEVTGNIFQGETKKSSKYYSCTFNFRAYAECGFWVENSITV